MPLYEYDCKSCNQVIELLVRTADQKPECPECGSGDLHKLISAPAAPAGKSAQQSLPVARPGGGCGAPRCCGGSCDS